MKSGGIKKYLEDVYRARFFWEHLARIELKNKFRRSKLGILWTCVSPLCLTAIMSIVLATAFHVDILNYAPYILSGLLFWDIMNGAFVGASYVIVANDAYIRQFSHPVTIYTLKSAIVLIISFCIALLSLTGWIGIIQPFNLLMALFTLPGTLCIYFVLAWSGATISAFTCTKYRDYPQLAPLILQTIWYVSPVFFQESMFESSRFLYAWFQANPITHLLFLLRTPFLDGCLPTTTNYLVSIVFVSVLAISAVLVNRKNARDIIFYI